MKFTKITSAVLTIGILGITSCGGGETDESKENDGHSTNSDSTEVVEAPVELSEFAAAMELSSKNDFNAGEFTKATVFLWEREGIVTGYPMAYASDPDTITLKSNNFNMIDNPDEFQKTISIKVKFKDNAEMKVQKGVKYAVKGNIYLSFSDVSFGNAVSISIYEAEIVPVDEANSASLSSIADIDLSKQMFCGDLSNVSNAYYDIFKTKESITVTGPFSHTVSSGTADANGVYPYNNVYLDPSYNVTCAMLSAPDADFLNAQRDAGKDVTIKGKFASTYSTAFLKDAEIVN